jgi:L-alanine-DL-glutamate epimerase-like enolase superfamily enzyme
VNFVNNLEKNTGLLPYFLEEVLGPANVQEYPLLRSKINTKIAGGEIVTTAHELCQRIAASTYDIAQPDATVIGGITPVLEIFAAAKRYATEVVVHCWGGPVGMMANYHAALAGGGQLTEWPMPSYPLREEMVIVPWQIENGKLTIQEVPGLGVQLTKEIEEKYSFREDAVYQCLVNQNKAPMDCGF